MKFKLPWIKRLQPPSERVSRIMRPADDIGDLLRARAIAKCEDALELAERAEAALAAYFLQCAIRELRSGR